MEVTEFRLADVGLPPRFMRIAKSVQAPSTEDLKYTEELRNDCMDTLLAIQERLLLEMEQSYPKSPVSTKLDEVITHLRRRLAAYNSVGGTWRKLPMELWDQIFWHHLQAIRRRPLQGWSVNDINTQASRAPAILSSVCKVWHAAVQASPSIWTDFNIPVDVTLNAGVPLIKSLDDTGLIIARMNRMAVKPIPWSLTISTKKAPAKAEGPGYAVTLPLPPLIQHHPSLSSVTRLSIFGPSLYVRLGALDLPSVSSILVLPTRHKTLFYSEDCFPRLIGLKQAVLIGAMCRKVEYFPHNLPWAQLTHLFLGNDLNPQELQAVLRMCTSLHEGCFWLGESGGNETWVPGNLGAATTTLNHLTDLTIMNSGGGRILRQLSFDHLTFPKLASIRAFLSSDAVLAASQLTSCINLTHLTLVGASFLVDWGYNIGEFLDACPLLNELVAPVQGYTEELYQQLTYDPARPRGRQLQVLVLLCFGLPYQAERDNIRMHVRMRVLGHSTGLIPHSFPISRIVEMVRTRRAAGSDASIDLGHPKQLRRFIYRFLEDPGGRGYELDLIMQLKEELAISLHTFSTDGLELSVEAFKHQPGISLTYCPLAGSHPAGHWDHDTMDFLKAKDGWVFSTSMPPNDSSESMDTS